MTTPPTLHLAPPRPRIPILGRSVPLDALIALVLAALAVLLGFATGSGVVAGTNLHLGANTWAEIILTFIGASALGIVLLWSARGPAHGALALLAFAALTTLTALSITWSVQPDVSWTAANQSVAYLGAFGAAIAFARVFPMRWSALCGAVPLFAIVISAYALLAKVFPALPDSASNLGRVTAPLGYWNAIGLIAAFGLPCCLWLGSRDGHGRGLRAAMIPAIALLVTTIVLSYSRSADAAAVISVAVLLAIAPTRMRMALVLLPGLLAAAVISVRALSAHALSDNFSNSLLDGRADPLAVRTTAGHSFGWFLLVALIVTACAGVAIIARAEQIELSAVGRRRVALGLLALAALIPLGAIAKLVTSARGPFGEISHIWSSLTSTSGSIGTGPERITSLSNSRPQYWHDALVVGAHHLLLGAGALGYATARTRYTHYGYPVQTAHGYLFQTFADFGLVGLGLTLVLLVAWAWAAWAPIGRAAPSPEEDDERTGLLTLLAVVLCFAINSAIDWTWFVPATALPALVCAGWLAGRGPLAAPIGRLLTPRKILNHPALPLAVTAITVVALGLAWAIWQPLRSVQAQNAAISAATGAGNAAQAGDEALARSESAQAFADAHAAVGRDPFSLSAMSTLASLYEAAGEQQQARAELVLETQRVPDDFASWYALGDYDLKQHKIGAALSELGQAAMLDRFDYGTSVAEGAAGAASERLRSRHSK